MASALGLPVRAPDSPAIAAYRAVGPADSGYHTHHLEGLHKLVLPKQSAPVADGGRGVLPCAPIFSVLSARWKDKVISREHGSHIDTRFFAYLVVTLFNPTGRGVPSYVAK